MQISVTSVIAATAVALVLSAAPAFAEVLNFSATLSGTEEVPPNDSAATGTVEATYDTDSKLFKWTVNYEGVQAAAAHFHGPADPGVNAPPVVPIPDDGLASPIAGEATLTDAQAGELQAGKWYFNLHSAAYPAGEIRGQVTKASAM